MKPPNDRAKVVTLNQLQEQRRELAARLLKEDATLADAKRFRSLCGEILYMEETIQQARQFNAGKASNQQLAVRHNPNEQTD